jgi:hypothetical protein
MHGMNSIKFFVGHLKMKYLVQVFHNVEYE